MDEHGEKHSETPITDENGKRRFEIPTITVLVQPEEETLILPRHKNKTVRGLLNSLGIRQGTAIVARNNELLTPDRGLWANDSVLVRKVTSSG